MKIEDLLTYFTLYFPLFQSMHFFNFTSIPCPTRILLFLGGLTPGSFFPAFRLILCCLWFFPVTLYSELL